MRYRKLLIKHVGESMTCTRSSYDTCRIVFDNSGPFVLKEVGEDYVIVEDKSCTPPSYDVFLLENTSFGVL
jgi:hypothetical protein